MYMMENIMRGKVTSGGEKPDDKVTIAFSKVVCRLIDLFTDIKVGDYIRPIDQAILDSPMVVKAMLSNKEFKLIEDGGQSPIPFEV